MPGWLDNPVFKILEKGLDAASLRQKVLANNIANVDTPGFKRSDVNFEAVFNEALNNELPLKRTSPKHLPGVSTGKGDIIQVDNSTTMRNDNNNVDIDREMTNVAENTLYYNGVARALSSQLEMLRTVIRQR